MDKERYQAELAVLSRKLPRNAFHFFNMEDGSVSEPYLRIGARTNSGNIYTLHMSLGGFPMNQPRVRLNRVVRASATTASTHGRRQCPSTRFI